MPYQIFFFLLKTLPDFPACFGVTLSPFDQTGLIAPISSSSSSSDGRICHSQDWADGGRKTVEQCLEWSALVVKRCQELLLLF